MTFIINYFFKKREMELTKRMVYNQIMRKPAIEEKKSIYNTKTVVT